MGIRGLLAYLLDRRAECSETVDLIQIAKDRGGIEILVDFYSFEHMIVRNLWKSLATFKHNEFLRILGAEYATIDAYVAKIVTDLKNLGILLTFTIDGNKGASDLDTKFKTDTWKQRHFADVHLKLEILDVCAGNVQMFDLGEEKTIRPALLEIQMVKTLRDSGCEVMQMAAGEADLLIAKQMKQRAKAIAVMSNDSDFGVFEGCCFIPNDLFDINNDLGLGQPLVLPKKPQRLLCGVISYQNVRKVLALPDLNSMIELSILAGNDFTKPHMPRGLAHKVGVRNTQDCGSYAEWVQRFGKVENNEVFFKEMQRNPALASAVQYSRRFYTIVEPFDDDGKRHGYVYSMIVDQIEKGVYSSSLLPMYRCFYWYRTFLEDVHMCPPAEEMLTPLRACIYAILLPKHKSRVTEYGQTYRRDFEQMANYAVDDNNIPAVNHIRDNQIFKNLRTFHYIMTHLDASCNPVPQKTWFDKYGRKTGFVCYVLRYFLLLNWQQNLNISETEFLALAATALGASKESAWQDMRVCPDPRCITIATVFQDIYRHAYLFLGSVLFLTHEFPVPKEIFCGSMWTILYALSKSLQTERMFPRSSYDQLSHIPGERLHWAELERDTILHEKRHILQHLTEDIFYFDDRRY